jgi:hypothetical protein
MSMITSLPSEQGRTAMWNPQKSDFSTWVRNTFKRKRRESEELFICIDIHRAENGLPGEKIFSWRGNVDNRS